MCSSNSLDLFFLLRLSSFCERHAGYIQTQTDRLILSFVFFFVFLFYFFFLIGCPRNVVIVLPGEVLSFPSYSEIFNHNNSSGSNDFGLIVRERFTWGQSNLLRVEVIFFFEPKYFPQSSPDLFRRTYVRFICLGKRRLLSILKWNIIHLHTYIKRSQIVDLLFMIPA